MKKYFPNQQSRLIILLVYIGIFFIANFLAFDQVLPKGDSAGLWFYTGLASIVLGNFLVTPLYIKPVDAISYAVASIIALYLVDEWGKWLLLEKLIYVLLLIFLFLIVIFSFIAIIFKDSSNSVLQKTSNSCMVLSDIFGNQKIVFSSVILFALIIFHRQEPKQFFIITMTWIIVTILTPEDTLYELIFKIRKIWNRKIAPQTIGNVIAYQNPKIILVRLSSKEHIDFGTPLINNDPFSPPKLSLALDYIGRDEALLLRCLEIPTSQETKEIIKGFSNFILPNSIAQINVDLRDYIENVSIFANLQDFIGLVTKDSSIDTLYFEIIVDRDIHEGILVEVEINHTPVIYQVIDGFTKEEIVYKKNTFGYIRGKAKKIGMWDANEYKFIPIKWLPEPNSPVFIKTTEHYTPRIESIGHFPSTNYSVDIKNLEKAVTHNTAILGILGIGKSMLAIEYIERMLAAGIKVICLDLTNQYEKELGDYYDSTIEIERIKKIQEAGDKDRNTHSEDPEMGGSLPNLRQAIHEELLSFLNRDNKELLKIFNPAQITGTKQLSDPRSFNQNGQWRRRASLWLVTPVEITQIITENVLLICQDEMTDSARVCLVYEEAHSLIPEWNTAACDGDKAATNATARAILQGRKFGLGCVLVTQRTANVTKTILNQCNTIFAMRTFDETGKNFLANYIGSDYATLLPSLSDRQAVFFGKASSCENPVLLRLNDQDEFRGIFREFFPPPNLSEIYDYGHHQQPSTQTDQ